ncbi:MAG: NUDIX domain-containing protein, partial [Chromatiales bacterium]|nr:NUDIX domain-containing protein [Chromatiales bacterium]
MTTDNDSREVDLLRRDTLFQSYFRVDQYELRHSLFAGGMGDAVVREVFERGHMAAVLPVNPANDSVVMIEQFRPGAYAVGWHPWLLECVAGVIEPGETASGVAGRETMEEAGCEIRHLE